MSIQELLTKYNSDKIAHSYGPIYEKLFAPLREKVTRVLEIGVFQGGGSLKAWRDYFPNAQVIGLDIDPFCMCKGERIETRLIDATNAGQLEMVPGDFDIIIDDGSHVLADQIKSFNLLFPKLKDDGLYVIEDIQNLDTTSLPSDIAKGVTIHDLRKLKDIHDDVMWVVEKGSEAKPRIIQHLKNKINPLPTRKKFIAICTPTLGAVSIFWAKALRSLQWPMNVGSVPFFMVDDLSCAGNNEIAENRNKLVQYALVFECESREITHLFWLDDDVICPAGALLRLLEDDNRPDSTGVCSGVYFVKGDNGEPLIFPSKLGGTIPFVPDQVYPAWGCGMGLTLVRMEVYKRLLAAGLPTDKHGRPEWYKTTSGQVKIEADGGYDMGGTEDLYFCDLAEKIGVRPLIDTGRFTFGFHCDLARRRVYPEEQWRQVQKEGRIVWQTANGPVEWK
jgi:hypothetical protein